MADRIPTTAAIAEMQRLADELGRAPRVVDMDDHGRYSGIFYQKRFGGWNAALKAAGLSVNKRHGVGQAEAIDAIHDIVDDLGEVPTYSQMNELGRFSISLYERKFGGWTNAVRKAGYEPRSETDPNPRTVPRERLFEELHQLRGVVERTPTAKDLLESGEYSIGTYQRHFGSWNNALRACGFEVNHELNIPDSVLETDLRRVVNELGRSPTADEYTRHGNFSEGPFRDKFGTWNNALSELGFEVIHHRRVSQEDFLSDLERVADELGTTPTREQYDRLGKYTGNVATKFGSWNECLDELGLDVNIRLNISDERLRSCFEAVATSLNRCPTKKELDEVGEFSAEPYIRRFGTWTDAVIHYGYEPYRTSESKDSYYGPDWPNQRHICIERDLAECVVCSTGQAEHYRTFGRGLHVHHIRKFRHEYEQSGSYEYANRLENLTTVCQSCHPTIENKPPEFFQGLGSAL